MVVQHNMTAMNAGRMLGITTNQQAKQSEKLASGYRINRAGDDAAGLKISEKMRSQIRGLQKASTNAQDGVSLIQTAEGALNEAHSILQRMNELAVQGANDTNEGIDRDAINEELTALTEELDRISDTTQFNKMNLLNGSFVGKKLQVGANADQYISITIGEMDAAALGLKSIFVASGTASIPAVTTSYQTVTVGQSGNKLVAVSYDGFRYSGITEGIGAASLASAVKGAYLSGKNAVLDTVSYATQFNSTTFSVYYEGYYASGKYSTAAKALAADKAKAQSLASADLTAGTIGTYLQTSAYTVAGSTITEYSTVGGTAAVADTVLSGPSVTNYEYANKTITAIQKAIDTVSSQRSALGALQNRLEHTIANLDNVVENTQAAESRIRDTDMASEMVEYSKNNILAQAGQSMLAQANQSTQGVLSLLQ